MRINLKTIGMFFGTSLLLSTAGCFELGPDTGNDNGPTDTTGKDNSQSTDHYDITKIDPPELSINNNGLATWYSSAAVGYVYNLNGTDSPELGTTAEARQLALKDGDTIKVRALAQNRQADSDWSAPKTYHQANYDFSGLGLSETCYETLLFAHDMAPGNFSVGNDQTLYKAENGDIMIGNIQSAMSIASSQNGYHYFEIHNNYTDGLTSDYSETDFGTYKNEYYTNWCLNIGTFIKMIMTAQETPVLAETLGITASDAQKIYKNYTDFVTSNGYDFLPKEVIDPQVNKHLELLEYTSWSNSGYKEQMNTLYIQKRNPSFLDKYQDKILNWSLRYCNFGNEYYYSDYILNVSFNENFTTDDVLSLRKDLSTIGVYWSIPEELTAEQKEEMDNNGIDTSLFETMLTAGDEGDIVVATYNCDGDIERYTDHYEYVYLDIPAQNYSMKTLTATYHNYTWIDGGCFCTASFQRDGFHRALLNDQGECVDHIIISDNK